MRDRALGIVPLAELLIVSALFWCVIAGDVASTIAGNLVFKEDGTPIGPETLPFELNRIRSEESMRDFASRRRWPIDPKEILADRPIEGRKDRDMLVREHTGQAPLIREKQQECFPSDANG